MVNNNMVALSALILGAGTPVYGALLVKSVAGVYVYAHGALRFPVNRVETFTLDAAAAGVSFGTGDTTPTPDDTNLQHTITSGINVVLIAKHAGVDAPGNPYLEYTFTITNTGSSTLVIREVGYKQELACATAPGGTSTANYVCLLDRTVLDTPLTLAAGDCGVLKYKIKTSPVPVRQISGVDIVSWEWGSGAQIKQMILAAREGVIDLQRDAGWRVGARRIVNIAAFTGGNNVAHAAQKINIAITSFDEYMECGNVLQYDYINCLAETQRMNPTNTTAGGYGVTEMYEDTLPAMQLAQEDWLRDLNLEFGVLTTKGSNSTELETVEGNKLALRSASEIFGSGHNGKAMEGDQIEYYRSGNRVKHQGINGSTVGWWERSPNSGNTFCYVNINGGTNTTSASYAYGVAPFGCI